MSRIILASSSKVRKEVLDNLGISFVVRPSGFEETIELSEGEPYEDLAKRLALGKAREVAGKQNGSKIVLGADSFAVFEEEILGKPKTLKTAFEYLKRLSGNEHCFYTGMALIDMERGEEVVDCAKAKIVFQKLSDCEISDYIEKEYDVRQAAAAYRIQSLGCILIERIEGDYYAVVGLSPRKVAGMFRVLGYNLFDYIT